MDFHTFIHAVGTGKKRNRDLTFEETAEAMRQMLDAEAYPEQVAAFLLGWRVKPETIEEYRGALHACDAYIEQKEIPDSVELGYPYDGKVKNPYLFPLVARLLEGTGLQIVMNGGELQPAKGGTTVKEITDAVELPENLHFFERKLFFKAMYELTPIRRKLGLRTAINTIEKLPNIARSATAISGVFHMPYVQKYIDIFADRYERFVVVKGNEGTPEVFSKCRCWIVKEGEVEELTLYPEYYGVRYKKSWEKISLEESLDAIRNPSDELLKLAKFNAAFLLFASGRTNDFNDAFDMVR